MATWYTAAQKIATGHIRHELQYPLREVVRADGKFPYRPGIVCPRPERKYEAQIGLENMERQAARAPPVPHDTMAKWGFEALASRAQSHFAHLRSPFAVADCALCRTSTVGCAVLDWVLTVASTNPTAPHRITWSTSTPTFRTPGCPGDSPLENIAEVTPYTSPGSDVRSQMVFCDNPWAPAARPPLLPDRDAVTTNSWHEACNISPGTSLEDENGRDSLIAVW